MTMCTASDTRGTHAGLRMAIGYMRWVTPGTLIILAAIAAYAIIVAVAVAMANIVVGPMGWPYSAIEMREFASALLATFALFHVIPPLGLLLYGFMFGIPRLWQEPKFSGCD